MFYGAYVGLVCSACQSCTQVNSVVGCYVDLDSGEPYSWCIDICVGMCVEMPATSTST